MTQPEATVFIGCLIAFAVLGLGLMALGLFTRKWPLMVAAGMAWLGLGIFLIIEAAGEKDIYWYFGWLGIALGIVGFTGPAWIRDREEPEPQLPPDEEYRRSLQDSIGKARALFRRRKGTRL